MIRRTPALAVTVFMVASAGFSALPMQVEADGIVHPRAAEVSAPTTSGAPVTVRLGFSARNVALHWAGAPDAQVKVTFSADGKAYGPPADAGRDEVGEQRANGRTYGLLLTAAEARFVRVTSDRLLPDLKIVAIADGAPTVSRHPAAKAAASGIPAILSRADWGADESLRYDAAGKEKWSPAFNPIQKAIVHHTDTQNGDPDPAATIRSIYYYHAVTQGWGDIGYNFLIDESGRIYKGRNSHTTTASMADDTITGEDSAGGGVTGAHAAGFNSGNVGIALLGTLSAQDATPAAKSALDDLLAWKANRHGIDPQGTSTYVNPVTGVSAFLPNIVGHRDVNATECPGGIFYATLPDVRAAAAGRIAAAPPDFTVFASPSSRTVPPGGAASYAVSLTGQSGFAAAVTLSAQGVPPGATASFSPPSVVPGQTSILTISTASGSNSRASSVTVMGASGTLAHTVSVGLSVGTADTTSPTVVITAHSPAATTDSTASFSFVATDPDNASSSLTGACSVDDSPFGGCTSPVTYGGLAPGIHAFGVRFTDPAGNSSTATFSWTVKPPRSGYSMVGSTGDVYAFGDAAYAGGAPLPGGAAAAGIAATPSGNGYRVVDSRGDVYAFGDAGYSGGSPPLRAGEQVTSLSSTPDAGGYWLFTNAGHAFAYGTARLFGDMSSVRLNGPVLGSVSTPSGSGYYMVAADGGIFAFGDARFAGSMGGRHLNKPVVGMAPNPNGPGYWLVAADGGVFAFGPAFQGSMGSTRLNAPVIGMVSYGNGYLMVASDGGIFDFSDRAFRGSLGGSPPRHPVVAVTALNG
jgi:hypothetical protein